jgi:hypothetical protein
MADAHDAIALLKGSSQGHTILEEEIFYPACVPAERQT